MTLVREGFEAWERGDLNALLALMADDLVTYRAIPDNATFHGKAGFLDHVVDWVEGFSEWSTRADEFVADNADHVVVRVRQVARGEASGAPVEEDFWYVFVIRDEKISRLSFYASGTEALEAAGLRE